MIGNIRENRAVERLKERETAHVPEGVRIDPPGQKAETAPERSENFAGPRSAQVIDMLKRLRPGQN
jgi:hypothetical protein